MHSFYNKNKIIINIPLLMLQPLTCPGPRLTLSSKGLRSKKQKVLGYQSSSQTLLHLLLIPKNAKSIHLSAAPELQLLSILKLNGTLTT